MLPVRVVTWPAVLVGFACFRVFDVLKPWPVRSFEKLPGGWGIVFDDVVAGMFGAGVLAALRAARVLP
jgi:phosphatidylglycerophosphatase A